MTKEIDEQEMRARQVAGEALEPLITECPSCLTRFRVSTTQLRRAGGKVRCGACLAVFNGVEHLTLESAGHYLDEEQARQALDDVLDELAGDADAAVSTPEEPVVVEPERRWRPSRAPIFSGYEDDDDDGGAEPGQEPAEVRHRPGRRPDRAGSGGERAAEPVPAEPRQAEPRQAEPHPAEPHPAEPRPAEAGAAEPRPADPIAAAAESADTTGPRPQPASAAVEAGAGRTSAALDSVAESTTPAAWAAIHTTVGTDAAARRRAADSAVGLEGAAFQGSPAVDLPAPEDGPVRFGEDRAPRRPLVWIGIAAGLLLLAAQVLWYQFDDWGNDPEWRGVYAPLCAVFGCQLPQQRDIALLSTRNLAVRSDAEQPDTLLVNAIIVNDADYAQPFPVLELRFTTVRGMLVAGRRFQPEEYLAGDAVGMNLIPPKTPVQIELTIDDPGPEAVNYFLRFL